MSSSVSYLPSEDASNNDTDSIDGDEGLPLRIFATDRYLSYRKVNSYSKIDALIDIFEILQGTLEYDIVVNSFLGPLFQLPARRCTLAAKLMHNFLSRQIQADSHEVLPSGNFRKLYFGQRTGP